MLNFLRERAHLLYKRLEVRDHPLQYLFLEITRRCNLSCLHCGSDCTASTDAAELTTDSWLKIVSYVKEHLGPQVAFVITGGEPLMHPDLDRIAEHIQAQGMRWGMVTNGMALTRRRLDRLVERGLNSITLSLDGTREAHNRLRGNPMAFDRVLAALELVGASPIPRQDAVTCVYPANLHELDAIAELLIERAIPSFRLFRIFPSGRAADDDQLLLTHEQTWQMLDWIAANRPRYAKRGLKVSASCEGYVPFATDRRIRDWPFFCRAGVNMAAILCDGAITGCSNNHESFHQGNVLTDSLARVWEEGFADLRERAWVAQTRCASCREVSKCQGGSIHLWKLGAREPAFCYVDETRRGERWRNEGGASESGADEQR